MGVSLDGTGEIHDRFRHMRGDRSATFDRVVRGIHLLEDYGVDFNILTVVHREVASHVREIYDFYRKMGWNYQQYIACLDPLGETRGKASSRWILPCTGNFSQSCLICGTRTGRRDGSLISGSLKIMSVSCWISAGSL